MAKARKSKIRKANASPVVKAAGEVEAPPTLVRATRTIRRMRLNQNYGIVRNHYGFTPNGHMKPPAS